MKVKRLASVALAGALCVTALTGCGSINKNDTIATLGDQQIKMGVANFMCRLQQANNEDFYASYVGANPWSQDPYSSGKTLQEQSKEAVMENLHEMYTVYNHMGEYNVSLSDEDMTKIAEVASAFIADNTKEAIKEMGASQEIVEEVLRLYTVRQRVYNAVIAEADTNVSDEEANMRAYSMIRVNTKGTTDASYNFTEYTEEEKAAITESFEKFVATIDNPAELEALAEASTEKYSVSTATYDKDDQIDEELRTALDSLKEGQMSGVVTTDSALYVVRIDKDTDEEATEKNRETIVQKRKDDCYSEKLKAWQEEAEWKVDEKELAKIQYTNSFTQKVESTESVEEPATEE